MTPCCNKQGKLFGDLRIVIQKLDNTLTKVFFHLWKMTLACFVHNNWGTCSIGILKHRRTEIVLLQNTNSAQTIEPSIRCLFIHFVDAFLLNTIIEGHPLIVESLCIKLSVPKCTSLHQLWTVLFGNITFLVEAKCSYLSCNAGF